MKKADYRPGQEVRLVKQWTLRGNDASKYSSDDLFPEVGDVGTVQKTEIQKQRNTEEAVAIRWNDSKSGKWTDCECIELTEPPVSDEEMKEVMESLGTYEPLGGIPEVVQLLRMHEAGDLTSDQTIGAMKIEMGIREPTDDGLILGQAISMATKGKIASDSLVRYIEFVQQPMSQ